MTQLRLWTSLTACVLLPASATASPPVAMPSWVPAALHAAGEGGEAGEAGLPSSYALLLDEAATPDYPVHTLRRNFVTLARAGYDQALADLKTLDRAIQQMLDQPTVPHLIAARERWVAAHLSYLRTEPLRYFDSPIDTAGDAHMPPGPESRINAWPLNEAVIDYVEGARDAGLIHQFDLPITRESVLARDQVSDEADITTGYHAIEFLLWGQDRSATGPGNRPVSDFDPLTQAGRRRGEYLRVLLDLLRDDLTAVRNQWLPRPSHTYAARLAQLDRFELVGRMLHGLTALTGLELASERLAVALDAGTQEDETNCFSDTSAAALQSSLQGVRAFYAGGTPRHSLSAVLRKLDPAADAAILAALTQAEHSAAKLPAALDQVLLAPAEDPRRQQAEQVVTDLQALARALKHAGRPLGVLVPVAGF